MWKLIHWALNLVFPHDTRKEYRVRCTSCYGVTGRKLDQPLTEDDRIRTIACAHCEQPLTLTIPIAPEEAPDDTGSRE